MTVAGPPDQLRRTVAGAIIGTAVEWYDFYLYATSAAALFNKLFFPGYAPLTGTLLAFGTFAVGFIVRPIGSVVLGRLGDRIGRKRVLIFTLLLMGGSTTAIGLLPTYAQAGVVAPILLTVLRALQGLGSGAEYAGAVLMVAESAPAGRRGLYSAMPYVGVALGLLVSLAAWNGASRLTGAAFEVWGWRVPFVLSAVILAIGVLLRSTLNETPVFAELERRHRIAKAPVSEVFRVARRPLLCAWGARVGDNSLAYIYESFVIVYAMQLGLAREAIVTALMISTAAQLLTVPLFGWLSDRVGRKPVYLSGALLSGAAAFPFFWLLETRRWLWIVLALCLVSSVAKTMMTAAQSAWLVELFPPQLRYTGFSLAREVTSPISGGLAPVVALALLANGHGSPDLVAVYVLALSLLTAVSVSLGPETLGRMSV